MRHEPSELRRDVKQGATTIIDPLDAVFPPRRSCARPVSSGSDRVLKAPHTPLLPRVRWVYRQILPPFGTRHFPLRPGSGAPLFGSSVLAARSMCRGVMKPSTRHKRRLTMRSTQQPGAVSILFSLGFTRSLSYLGRAVPAVGQLGRSAASRAL